jgi:hypothetical protein
MSVMSRCVRYYDTPPKEHGPTFQERDSAEKDDNKLIAKAFKRQNRRVK